MTRFISIMLTLALLMTTAFCRTMVLAQESSLQLNASKADLNGHVAYLDEYHNFSNVVGCLNANGTKTVYLFGDQVDSQTVESITGLSMSNTESVGMASTGEKVLSMEDATVYSNSSSTNYGAQLYNEIGTHSSRGIARSFFKFDLSSLPISNPDNIISSYFYMMDCDSKSTIAFIDAYLVKSSWSESTITWNNRPDYYAGEKLGTLIYQSNGDSDSKNHFYLTKAVKAWVQGVPNYGIMLKENDDGTYRRFASTEHISVPYLMITYIDEVLTETPGISSGDSYYVVNKNSGKYMEAEGSTAGSGIHQNAGTGSSLQTWVFTHRGNGYYSIKLSGTNVYLTTTSGSITNIQLGSYNGNYSQWQIKRNWNGSYRIYNRAYSSYVMFLPGSATANFATIYLNTYTHNYSFGDEWSIIPAARGEASVYCFNYTSYNPTTQKEETFNTTAGMNLLSAYMDDYNTEVYVNSTATHGFNKLQTSPIFILSSHGAPSTMCFFQSNGAQTTIGVGNASATHSINELALNSLAHQQLMLIQTCNTGRDDENGWYNLVGQSYRLGSHNLISNTCNTVIGPDSTWLLSFMSNLSVGRSIGYSKDRADEAVIEQYEGKAGGIPQRHDLGDNSVYLLSYPTSSSSLARSAEKVYGESFQIETESVNDEQVIRINNQLQTLVKVGTSAPDVFGKSYDIYRDENGGLYHLYAGSDILQSYQPYTDHVKLGDTEVHPIKALTIAQSFLSDLGYDVSGFECETSNNFSKNYRIVYRYKFNNIETSEKVVLYMQADENGDVYLTNLMAFDYGMFSSDRNSVATYDTALFTESQLEESIQATYGNDTVVQKIYWTKSSLGTVVLRALIARNQNGTYHMQVVDL